MLMHNNNSIPLLDVSALLHQVSTTLVPSLAPSTNSSMLLLPSSTSLTSTASRDNIKTIKMIAYCYILPAVCVLGIIGNLMNVITLASPRLRAVSYMYLRALAIADLLCMCFVLVFASFEVLKEVVGLPIDRHPMFGFYQAHIMLSFINWTLSTGVLIVVALSLERYVSVVFPLHFRVWNSPQRALKAIIVAYLVPAVFYIPYGIGRYSVNRSEAPNGEVFYYPDDSAVSKTVGWQIYKWTREGLLRFLPIVILFVLNSQIMVAFRRRQKMFNRLRNRDQTTIARDDTLLYILGGIAVMFFVCNIPAAINLLFINETVKKRLDYQIFRAMANLLEITNHSAQFYIFCVCSSDYRITFMQKFPCLRAYYISPKFYSFIRNVPKRSGDGISGGGAGGPGVRPMLRRAKSEWTTTKYDEEGTGGRSTEGMLCMRSTTVTAELASTCEGKVAEQETVDSRVQLASEESFSDESDTLLNNNSSKMAEMDWRIDRVTTGRAVLLTEGSAERQAAASTNDTYFL
uniref:G-protein coupled receptors family 1 profile domain-containing protein n=1 Tax=Globodera rostochiensis TaxID=31243 RepID=A0A914H1I5_GLORO